MSDSPYPARVDVAIVGSGPAGATYARVLSEESPGSTIAMFEVGPTVSDPPGAHVRTITDPDRRAEAQRRSEGPGRGQPTFDSPGEILDSRRRARPGTFLLADGYQLDGEDGLPLVAMSSNVGGMAAHWTGACPRPFDSERIPFLPDMDDLLAEAERLLGVTTDAFDETSYGDLVRGRLADAVDNGRAPAARVRRMPLAVDRRADGRLVWSGSDTVFGAATRANPGFELFDETQVARVLVEDGRAAGVVVRDLRTGERHVVAARFVVVAADALRTPQLLWASGIRPPALGRYLNDQTQVVHAARLRDVAPAGSTPPPAEGTLAEQSGVSWIPFTDDVPFHGQVMQLDASPVPLADDDPVAPGSIVGLGLFCPKDLQETDRVEFATEDLDHDGMPALRVHYTLTDRDRTLVARAVTEITRLAEAVGDPLGPAPVVLPLGASLHYQGTVRMGQTDDGTSVCGPDSELWAVPGVFVAGNGVIPTATACNPTLTSVALAVRGARRISRAAATSAIELISRRS
jgi:choline dehydrogenase-like flavoprotein